MKKIIIAISALLCAASALYGQEFNYDKISHYRISASSEVTEITRTMVSRHGEDLRFFVKTGGLNAMMDLSFFGPDVIVFTPNEYDSDFVGNCISVKQVQSLQDEIVKDLRETFTAPGYLPYFAMMVNASGRTPKICRLCFVEKFNPRSKKEKVRYKMDIPFSTLFPDWDEKYDIVKILEPDLKRCSAARKKELGYGEYLGCLNGIVSLGYDYGNADFASRDDAWTGVLRKLSIILDTYDGDMWNSLEHLAICTGKDISMTLRNRDTGESESAIFTIKQLAGLKGRFNVFTSEDTYKNILASELKKAREYTSKRDVFINAKKNAYDIQDKLKPIMEKYKAEYNSCKAKMSVPAPLKTVTVLRTADNVVNWYDLLDRNVISREEVLKLIVANTEQGHNYVNYLLCGWANGDMSKSFFFNLVPNKGTLVRPVSYAFSPEDIYNALKGKYGN